MNIWNSIPSIRILLALIAGLSIGINFPAYTLFSAAALLIIWLIAVAILKYKAQIHTTRYIRGISINFFIVLFGIVLVNLKTELSHNDHFSNFKFNQYVLQVNEPLKNKTKTYKTIGKIVAVKSNKRWISTSGNVLLYTNKDSASAQLEYGNLLLCNAQISITSSPKNPKEFDYKKYLAFHQIYHQVYLDSESWLNTGVSSKNPIYDFAYSFRNKLLQIISAKDIKGDEFAIGSALILGYEDDLSNEVIGAFAATGALHVLSVSGLHVGIIFIVLSYLLGFLGESKYAKITRFALVIIGLWVYAILTGLSPSVTRAATMFSLILTGKFVSKDVNTYNIIGASAILLLCINPFIITEVGFQLSYLAVIGIVTLHEKLYKLFFIKNKFLDQTWSITCVSLSAQAVTFPLGLLYFHQFPNYFLFSNLLVIPISTLILYNGLLLLAISKVPVVGTLVAKMLFGLLWALNKIVAFFEQLPYAILDGISISVIDTLIIYLFLTALFSYFLYKKAGYLYVSAFAICFFMSTQIYSKFELKHNHQLVIYAINKHTAIDFIQGNNNVILADSALLQNKDMVRFHFIPNWNDLSLRNPEKWYFGPIADKSNAYLKRQNPYYFFGDLTILQTATLSKVDACKYQADIVVLSKSSKLDFKHLATLFPKAQFICDGTISTSYFNKIKTKMPGINLRSVNETGAIIIKV